MSFKKSLCVATATLMVGCAQHAKKEVTHVYPQPSERSVASTPEEIAKAYLNLGVTLSKARANTGVCESGVYQENIIQALNNARQFDFDAGNMIYKALNDTGNPDIQAIVAQVGNTLSFKLLKSKNMGLGAYRSSGSIEDLLEGTVFESQGVGAYGHFLEYHFNGGNKVTKKRLTNIDSWPIEWSETEGTWEANGYSNKHGGPLVSMKTKYLTGPNKGKNKTEVFVIKQTCEYGGCFYGLVPVNKIKEPNRWSNPSFYDFRVFDLKTDECDA